MPALTSSRTGEPIATTHSPDAPPWSAQLHRRQALRVDAQQGDVGLAVHDLRLELAAVGERTVTVSALSTTCALVRMCHRRSR
jgi:hypothetical protein